MANDDHEHREAAQERGEAVGIRMFAPPPKGFVPVRARDRDLLKYGYPPRPDAGALPELHERWQQMMSRPVSIIQPQFVALKSQPITRTVGPGWSGSTVHPPDGDTITLVSGGWTVPHVVDPGAHQSRNACATWIGIDGSPGGQSGDILQAGTTQSVHPLHEPYGPGLSTFAWHQWFWKEPPYAIPNLLVSPGDVMSCAICVHSPTEAGVYMLNLTTYVGTSFIKTAPEGIRLVGNSAEWILESPNDGSLGDVPKFGEVYFDDCIAATPNVVLLGGNGHLMNLIGQTAGPSTQHPTTSTMKRTDRLITITYLG